MADRYDIAVKVISQNGTCSRRHKVGDEWIVGDETLEGICLYAFDAISPQLQVLKFGGSFPWSDNPDTGKVACPDPDNPVVFELRRLRK